MPCTIMAALPQTQQYASTGTSGSLSTSCCLFHHPLFSYTLPPIVCLQCKGFGSKCIVDLNGAPNPLFLVGMNAILSGELNELVGHPAWKH